MMADAKRQLIANKLRAGVIVADISYQLMDGDRVSCFWVFTLFYRGDDGDSVHTLGAVAAAEAAIIANLVVLAWFRGGGDNYSVVYGT
jgi:hypothetical protein